MAASLALYRTMIARVSPDDIVLYANSAMAAYLKVSKRTLVGAPLDALASRATGEISECFQRPTGGKTGNRLVTDAEGRVFELKTYSDGGVLDIVLDEVTTVESVNRDLQYASGTSVELLNEEELRTARQPERRFMTITHSRLNGIAHLAGHLAPMETRLMVNSFAEEAADAVLETGCTVHHAAGEAVVGLFGAPRYFADHALRALRSACNQIEKGAALRSGFFRQGKEMPPMSCGIWTGEAFVGTLGSSTTLHYTAIGEPVDLAAELCRLARPGEVLVSEFTVRSIVQNLPEGWDAVRAESESDPDLSDFQWTGDELTALAPEFVRGVWLVGPGVAEDSSRMEFYLDYLWALKVAGHDDPVPILRAVRPAVVGDSLELSADNVVASQFSQTLGKYKLLSVIGTGGMGKVWKAQDRYGNIVAIKVLHSIETASDSQLKRFKREAEIMARLPHRNICRVFEMSEFEGIQFLVMEYVDGLTLSDLLYERTGAESQGTSTGLADLKSLIVALRSEKSAHSAVEDTGEGESPARPKVTRILPVEQTLNIFLKVAEAVQFAHEHGVLHRDLKPGNILLREDGEPLVADFGLAKLESEGSGHSLSVTGNVVGTLENMAPEQAESSKNVDERADVYALGTILFQMLTGRRHFEATGNIVADAQALQNHEPPRPRTINPRLDSDLEIILLKALRNSPAERYRTVDALKSDIERYRLGEVISARPVSAIELLRKLVMRNRAVSAVIIASLIILITGSVAAFWKISERAEAAEKARLMAEDALAQAEVQREAARSAQARAEEQAGEAERQSQEAQRQRKEAEAAVEKMRIAQEAEEKAKQLVQKSQNETEEQRQAREAAEKARTEAEAQLAMVHENRAKDEEIRRMRDRWRPPFAGPENRESEAARRSYESALQTFLTSLSPFEVGRLDRVPEEVVRRIDAGIEQASEALMADPSFTPAWLLKGRLHLAALETDQARQAFLMAGQSAESRRANGAPDLLAGDDPAQLAELAGKMPGFTTDRFKKAAEIIHDAAPREELIRGIMEFVATKPAVVKSGLGGNPLGRKSSEAETAVGILAANGGVGKVTQGPGELTISGIENLPDLRVLKNLPALTRLKVEGASKIDWATLAVLPLTSLDLSGCSFDQFPPNLRGFSRLRNLSLKGTGIADLSFARWLTMLEGLDISGTSVTDLAGLAMNGRLRTLDAGSLNLQNIRSLLTIPIERLTISPLLVTDAVGLKQLRGQRTIKVLRMPDDPENQSAAEFWRKLDSGEYATGGGTVSE